MIRVYKATNVSGEAAHFGHRPTAQAWAGAGGMVENIDVRERPSLRTVSIEPEGWAAAFEAWWDEQARRGDPARRPNLVRDAWRAAWMARGLREGGGNG